MNTPSHDLLRPVMPELDSLRGIAILGVLFLHGFFWQYSSWHFSRPARFFLRATQPGWLGVNLFFVLSGFLITGILLDSKARPHFYKRFYVRRALRILPAYYLLLLLLGLLGQARAAYLGLGFVYLANVTELFGVAEAYGPLWSLAVEEHYYLFWPAVVRRLGKKGLAIIGVGICILVPILRAISFAKGFTYGLASYTWFVLDGLAAGSLLAILLRTNISRATVKLTCFVLFTVGLSAAIIGAPYGILTRNSGLGAALQHTVISVLFSGVLLTFLLIGTSPWKTWVNHPVLVFFGYISYGLYLIHLLMFRLYDKLGHQFWPSLLPTDNHFGLVLLRFACAGGVAVAMSCVSRKYFENRFLALKARFEPEGNVRYSSASIGYNRHR
jgi:peptidoglycan/LPS O-acetylase OafA/YrhL